MLLQIKIAAQHCIEENSNEPTIIADFSFIKYFEVVPSNSGSKVVDFMVDSISGVTWTFIFTKTLHIILHVGREKTDTTVLPSF